MLLYSLLFLTFSPILLASGDKMSWCDYWYRRGIARAECSRPRQTHWSLVTKAPRIEHQMLSMPICDLVTDWGRCQRADHCPLGLLCWVKGNPCCTPQTTNRAIDRIGSGTDQCPTPKEMGIQCNARSTVNWCNNNSDCHRLSAIQRCCSSGCGYNLCVRVTPPVDMNARLAALSVVPERCPAMDVLSIGCSRQHGTSWCSHDGECYNNGAQQRRCCPTRCGYNVCLLKVDDNRWIIA